MNYESWTDIKPGDRFGRLVVVGYAGKNYYHQPSFFCNCKCGIENYIVSAYSLLNGRVYACNHCRQVKDLAGPRCPFPCRSCKDNMRGVCCHECPKEKNCVNACESSTAPYPNGCGRDEKVNL